MSTVWTVGHGNATADELLERLTRAGIALVVDVRSRPYSRFHPQHSRPALSQSLESAGIGYAWKGANLGGLGENVRFQETVREVAELARHTRVALLCSESDPASCHRKSMLAPAFQAEGLDVVHLLRDGTQEPEPNRGPDQESLF